MPQQFNVLKCYSCNVFQVHQVKKSIKWQCKLCGEKQSRKKCYGFGTAKECRLHVQKLNGIRADFDSKLAEVDISEDEEEPEEEEIVVKKPRNKLSKWANYMEKPDLENDEKEDSFPEVQEIKSKRMKYIVPFADKINKTDTKPCLPKTTKASDVEGMLADNFISKPLHTSNTQKISLDSSNTEKSIKKESLVTKSKWSQYVDTEKETIVESDYDSSNENITDETNKIERVESQTQSEKPKDIFSLDEEYDLDDVLAI